jgi:PAS domain S-box-containing protein
MVAVAAHHVYRSATDAYRAQALRELEAIAALKVDQVTRWRRAHLAQARAMASDAGYMFDARELPREEIEAQVRVWLDGASTVGDATAVALLGEDGEAQVLAGAQPVPFPAVAARSALATGDVWSSDVQEDAAGVSVDFVAPLPSRRGAARRPGQPAGVLLRVDPVRSLFPAVAEWPLPRQSGEVVLVRPDGDGALVLNALRLQRGAALRLRIAPSAPGGDLLVRAAQGQDARAFAPDYRGVATLAVARPVPGTGWGLVAKLDTAEAYAPARERLAWAIAALLALGMAVATLWWRTRKVEDARRRSAAAVEHEALVRRLAVLTRWSYDLVFLVDDRRRVVEANDRAAEALGYTHQELRALTLADLREPRAPEERSPRPEASHLDGTGQWETRYRRKDGSTFPVEVAVHAEAWDGRRWLVEIVRDLSERRRQEDALRTSEARFRAAFDGVSVGMALLDRDGRMVETNRALQAMLGVGERDLRDALAIMRVHPDERADAREQFRSLRDGAVKVIEGSRRYRREDGSFTDTRARVTALTDAAGRFQYALAMVEDVSERHQLEAQLRLADRMASVGTLAAGVAHEINNPLAFVLANLEFGIRELRREGTSQDVLAALEEAREGGTRVREIVRDLKTFSRAEDAVRGVLDVGRVVRSALSLVANEIRARARLDVQLGPTPRVLASEHRLAQVFVNLLVNAAQAIPEGAATAHTVRVETSTGPDGRAVVTVSDDGAGIPAEVRPRIFDPFFTTKPVGVGTGLGLSICHGIVAGLGGEITVESALDRGSTFRVTLPAAPPELEPVVATAAAGTAGRRARVLVVDDEPLVCRAVQRILSPPHDVRIQPSALRALELLTADSSYDLVLCDLMMPEMTGMDLHQRLAAVSPELAGRFVFLTGGAYTPAASAFFDRVQNPKLEKPFDPATLRELVNRLVNAPFDSAAPERK